MSYIAILFSRECSPRRLLADVSMASSVTGSFRMQKRTTSSTCQAPSWHQITRMIQGPQQTSTMSSFVPDPQRTAQLLQQQQQKQMEEESWKKAATVSQHHLRTVYKEWKMALDLSKKGSIVLNGKGLRIGAVVAVAKFGCKPFVDLSEMCVQVALSTATLQERMNQGEKIYGVNTGFGGSADTRTMDHEALQRALTQHQQSAVLARNDLGLGDEETETSSAMPTAWVRGAMVVRVNSLVRGHSGVGYKPIETLAEMVRRDMIPIVPLRGSISASGDLMPLSYIAGALQGNPDIFVRTGKGKERKTLSAPDALAEIHRLKVEEQTAKREKELEEIKAKEVEESKLSNKARKRLKRERKFQESLGNANYQPQLLDAATALKDLEKNPFGPVVLQGKDGLALVNGTAPSATVASLALYETNLLVFLAQVMTCVTSEALCANVEWVHPFIAEIRPHHGQMEVARNLRMLLRNSKLVSSLSGPEPIARGKEGLAQDRYAIRSSPQWLGPHVDDLFQSTLRMGIELNSTTDNPVVSSVSQKVYNGANFQATEVAVAMEKARLAMQMIGKMLFAQTSELINPNLSNGLPPNLAADNPSLSFCLKGADINMAAYQSELGFLANPVTSHVQSAELHNQSINSLALVAARYAMKSVDTLSLMTATAIYIGLQAVDMRVMHMTFLEYFPGEVKKYILQGYGDKISAEGFELIFKAIKPEIHRSWIANSSRDLEDRCRVVSKSVTTTVFTLLGDRAAKDTLEWQRTIFQGTDTLRRCIAQRMPVAFVQWRQTFAEDTARKTVPMLSDSTKALYQFVRGELGVPFHLGLVDDPLSEPTSNTTTDVEERYLAAARESDKAKAPGATARPKKTIGSWISIIYEAIRSGKLPGHLLDTFKLDIMPDDFQHGPDAACKNGHGPAQV
ncbi:Phenylalanine ammonia-lyase hkm12 [Exophiala dermatitidis]